MGWIKLHRDIQDHWIWRDKEPFDTRSAWMDLLLLANYEDFKTKRKGKIVSRKRGEVNASSRYLADRWHWSRNRVNRFLRLLESDGMVSISGATGGTTITIENYSKWQELGANSDTTDGADVGATDDTTGGATDGANDKKYKKYKNTTPTIEEVREYVEKNHLAIDADYFFEYYEDVSWTKKNGKPVSNWKLTARSWHKREVKDNGSKPNFGTGNSKRSTMAGSIPGSQREVQPLKGFDELYGRDKSSLS